MRKLSFLILGLIYTTVCLSQTEEKISYKYEKMNVNYQKDYNNADFILEYIFTDGISLGDRYTYSIIVTDSIVTLKFTAPDFGSYNYVNYVKQFKLEREELDSLKFVTKKANLKQLKPGIAHWQGSMYTREILIVKCDKTHIAGGQTYGPIGTYADNEPDDKVEKAIEKDKKDSSSISGDYNSIIKILKKYFKIVDELEKDAYKYY